MNFEKLFKDFNIDYSTKTNRGWVNVRCIYCGGSSYKFGFSPTKNFCTCFACGGHNLYDSLCKILNVNKSQLKEILPNYEGRTNLVKELNHKTIKPIKLELPTDTFISAERKYLKSRGFNPSYLNEKYNVVGGGMTGSWKYRIIIPLIVGGKVVSWTGRSILSKEECERLQIPRYRNLSVSDSIIDCKSTLFNLDNCFGDSVVLTEGPMDVLKFDGPAICSFGTQMTEIQLKIINDRFKKVFILFDNESEAQKKAKKYGVQLSSLGADVEIVDAFSDFNRNDMGECSESEIRQIKKELGL